MTVRVRGGVRVRGRGLGVGQGSGLGLEGLDHQRADERVEQELRDGRSVPG